MKFGSQSIYKLDNIFVQVFLFVTFFNEYI
jgi:hypothetical protein